MPKYRIVFLQEVSQRLELEIEADSPEHAAKLARDIENEETVQNQSLNDCGWETLWDCVNDAKADAIYGPPEPGKEAWEKSYAGTVDELDPEGAAKPDVPRVLIGVEGGVATYSTQGNVDVLLIDYDNDPDAEIPDDWADVETCH